MSLTQQPPMQPQHSRAPQLGPSQPGPLQSMSQHHSTVTQSKSKTTSKISPKPSQHTANNQQSGPKGSITHGTPVNANVPVHNMGDYKAKYNLFSQAIEKTSNHKHNLDALHIRIGYNPKLSPRFDGMRQTPPSNDKSGSITQGTPVHMPPHHLTDKRVYDYSKY